MKIYKFKKGVWRIMADKKRTISSAKLESLYLNLMKSTSKKEKCLDSAFSVANYTQQDLRDIVEQLNTTDVDEKAVAKILNGLGVEQLESKSSELQRGVSDYLNYAIKNYDMKLQDARDARSEYIKKKDADVEKLSTDLSDDEKTAVRSVYVDNAMVEKYINFEGGSGKYPTKSSIDEMYKKLEEAVSGLVAQKTAGVQMESVDDYQKKADPLVSDEESLKNKDRINKKFINHLRNMLVDEREENSKARYELFKQGQKIDELANDKFESDQAIKGFNQDIEEQKIKNSKINSEFENVATESNTNDEARHMLHALNLQLAWNSDSKTCDEIAEAKHISVERYNEEKLKAFNVSSLDEIEEIHQKYINVENESNSDVLTRANEAFDKLKAALKNIKNLEAEWNSQESKCNKIAIDKHISARRYNKERLKAFNVSRPAEIEEIRTAYISGNSDVITRGDEAFNKLEKSLKNIKGKNGKAIAIGGVLLAGVVAMAGFGVVEFHDGMIMDNYIQLQDKVISNQELTLDEQNDKLQGFIDNAHVWLPRTRKDMQKLLDGYINSVNGLNDAKNKAEADRDLLQNTINDLNLIMNMLQDGNISPEEIEILQEMAENADGNYSSVVSNSAQAILAADLGVALYYPQIDLKATQGDTLEAIESYIDSLSGLTDEQKSDLKGYAAKSVESVNNEKLANKELAEYRSEIDKKIAGGETLDNINSYIDSISGITNAQKNSLKAYAQKAYALGEANAKVSELEDTIKSLEQAVEQGKLDAEEAAQAIKDEVINLLENIVETTPENFDEVVEKVKESLKAIFGEENGNKIFEETVSDYMTNINYNQIIRDIFNRTEFTEDDLSKLDEILKSDVATEETKAFAQNVLESKDYIEKISNLQAQIEELQQKNASEEEINEVLTNIVNQFMGANEGVLNIIYGKNLERKYKVNGQEMSYYDCLEQLAEHPEYMQEYCEKFIAEFWDTLGLGGNPPSKDNSGSVKDNYATRGADGSLWTLQ